MTLTWCRVYDKGGVEGRGWGEGAVRGIQRDLEKSSGFAWLSRPQPASTAKDMQTASVFITRATGVGWRGVCVCGGVAVVFSTTVRPCLPLAGQTQLQQAWIESQAGCKVNVKGEAT